MKSKTVLLSAIIICIALSSITAKVWRVNNNGFSADYIDLQTAINAAQAHDTLHVEASGTTYASGGITLTKPLVLIGPGYFLNMNTGLQKNPTTATIGSVTLNAGSQGTVLTGLSINSSVFINANSITIERCYLSAGIGFQNVAPSTLDSITIKQCYIANAVSNSGNQCGAVNHLLISNSYFGGIVHITSAGGQNNYQGLITQCVFNNDVTGYSANVVYRNNIMKNGTFSQNVNSTSNVEYNLFAASTVPAWLSGGSNVAQASNIFITTTGSTDHDLMQNNSANCPTCYQGYPNGTGTIGMYGGNDPYLLSGLPAIPTIYQLQSPSPVEQGDTLKVNFSTRSNN